MAVGSVQDVMLAAVAVGGMQDSQDVPRAQDATRVQQTPAGSAVSTEQTAAQQADQKQVEHKPLTEEQTAYITKKLNEIMRSIDVNLQFQYHKEVNFMSVRMLDKQTGEVLREVPPEAMVEHMIKVHDWIGAFLDKTA